MQNWQVILYADEAKFEEVGRFDITGTRNDVYEAIFEEPRNVEFVSYDIVDMGSPYKSN